ncbi:hypothetical protein Adt_32027 [Abeliophyllum distichum]|uniref:Uncharacterized protein n=1 Tax=Abeliophyllum distichum TaxID=126358 RepID=A0ABD1RH06_9LAMI
MDRMAEAKIKKLTDENTWLSSENEAFHSKLELIEECRWQVEYRALKAESIIRIADNTRRRAEDKLKAYEEMAYAKHSHLVKARTKLAKANEQISRLESPTRVDPKEAMGP